MSGESNGRQRGQRTGRGSPAQDNTLDKPNSKKSSDSKSDSGALTQERTAEEIVEWETPKAHLDTPVELILPEKVLTERWRINRTLLFQGVVTFLCLLAVVINPEPTTQMAAVSICLGSFAFSRYALERAYRR